MSETSGPELDPDSDRPMGDLARFTRRKITPAHVALAALLAVIITAIGFGVLALVLWAFATLIH